MSEKGPTRIPRNTGELRATLRKNAASARILKYIESTWDVYNSSLNDMGETFIWCLPMENQNPVSGNENNKQKCGEVFKKYIEQILQPNQQQGTVAVEFGGPGSRLFFNFGNFFNKTVGVCLKDIRSNDQIEIDKYHAHSVVTGDILDIRNFDRLKIKLKETLDRDKIDLIISHMCGALRFIDKNPAFLEVLIRYWYNLLNENGLMFLQFYYVPARNSMYFNDDYRPLYDKIVEWAREVCLRFPEIDIQVSNDAIRLHKKIGAPSELPKSITINQ